MRLELKYNSKSSLGYHRIEILTPNIKRELHLCDTEHGLVAIPACDLVRELPNYQKLTDRASDLSHVLRGKL